MSHVRAFGFVNQERHITDNYRADANPLSFRVAALNFIEEAFITLSLSILAFAYVADVTNWLSGVHLAHSSLVALRNVFGHWLLPVMLTPVQIVATSLPLGVVVGVLLHRYAIRYAIFVAAVATFSMWGMTAGDPQGVAVSLLVASALVVFSHWASHTKVSRMVESLWNRPRPSLPRFVMVVASDVFLALNFVANAAVWRNVFLSTGDSSRYEPYVLRFAVLVLVLAILIRCMVWARGNAHVVPVAANSTTQFSIEASTGA